MAKSTTRRPRLPTASATANGRLPPPQIIASRLSAAVGAAAASLMLRRQRTHEEGPWSVVVSRHGGGRPPWRRGGRRRFVPRPDRVARETFRRRKTSPHRPAAADGYQPCLSRADACRRH